MQSELEVKKSSLLKALKREQSKKNPDRETILMLDLELYKLSTKLKLSTK